MTRPGPSRDALAALAVFAVFAVFAALAACGDDEPIGDVRHAVTLRPGGNPFGPADPLWAPQPLRLKPQEVAVNADGRRAFVSLPGTIDRPDSRVAIVDGVDGAQPRLVRRVQVGSAPLGLALHPQGRWLVVTLRTSNHLAIVDADRGALQHLLATDAYTIDAAFDPSGERLVLSNRWKDAVAIWRVRAEAQGLRVLERGPWLPVAANPRDVAVSADGRWAAVGALTGLDVAIVDLAANAVSARVSLGAPSNGVAFAGRWLVVATLSASTHHPAAEGPDGDGDGSPGDGTPNINFQDLQNEIAVIDPSSGAIAWRGTSDSIWGRDYRDVDPRDLARGGALLPPPERRVVAGALPEGVVASADGATVWVGMSGSDEVQSFAVDAATGALTPLHVAAAGGHQPMGLALAGGHLLVAHRLGETLGVLDATTLQPIATVVVGDVSAGAFPATDVEIGELINFVTAPMTVDGDQTCAHCHREEGNIDKAFSMPLLARAGRSSRMTMAYRGAYDTRPWFHEAAMDQGNFLPVLNEFMRIENFCCTDYTLFGPAGAPKSCGSDPPDVCASAPNASSADGVSAARLGREAFASPRPTPFVERDAFVRDAARRLVGRDTSFGDGLAYEHPITGVRAPIALDFAGVTRAIGLFLLAAPRLLPNPNPRSAAAARGERLFERFDVGCAGCHPAPAYTVADDVTGANPAARMLPVVTPMRDAEGRNLDLLAPGFVATFALAEQDRCEDVAPIAACAADPSAGDADRQVRFGAPSLRGLWDRAPGMLHHGRARGLREVLCAPGHPALRPGEVGRNERDGVPDSHGGTSHLSVAEIEDLIAFLQTL